MRVIADNATDLRPTTQTGVSVLPPRLTRSTCTLQSFYKRPGLGSRWRPLFRKVIKELDAVHPAFERHVRQRRHSPRLPVRRQRVAYTGLPKSSELHFHRLRSETDRGRVRMSARFVTDLECRLFSS